MLSVVKDTPTVDQLKLIHDMNATVVQILTQRVQFYHEEFDGVKKMVEFYTAQCKELSDKIKELTPEEEKTEETKS